MIGLLIPVFALAMLKDVCPITIGVGKDGRIFTDVFQGWYRSSPKSLDGVLHGGCYNDSNPSPVTSVRLFVADGAPQARIDLVLTVLQKDGWQREKINVQHWEGYPARPVLHRAPDH